MIEALTQDLGWLRVSVSAHPFSADRAVFAEMKGSRPLVDIPSHEVLGAINPNEEVAGPHSPSTSGARRYVWGSPTVARSFISAAAMPFFFIFCTQGILSGLHSNTKSRSAAVHN